MKYASDKFDERRQELIDEGKSAYVDMVDFYTMKSVFYLPPESRWSYIMEQSKQSDIALKIDTALFTIEKNNPSLKGALPDNYYSRLGLDTSKLASLLDEINKIHLTKDKEQDVMGRVYEYFLSNFALQEGKGKGEFYTPKCIVNLIAELIEPYKGKIYDPCCGSGGMFVQSMKFVQAHNGNTREIAVFGQEATNTTLKLARMNLAIRGINGTTDSRAYELLEAIIAANPECGNGREILATVKSVLSGGQAPRDSDFAKLRAVGFEVVSEQNHYKLRFMGNEKYWFTLFKTPSDARSGKNLVSDITKKISIYK